MDVRLLGPVAAADESGRTVEVRRQKQRALLAALALRAGEVVSTDRLLEDLWGEKPPRTAVGSLQNLVSQLRAALGRDVLQTRAPGYVLNAETDVALFDRLLAEAREAAGEVRARHLREALALWRGPALADVAFEPFAVEEIARLDELRTAARGDLAEAELVLGRHAEIVGELEALVAEQPFRERPRALLMLALYRSGRQADALEAYREARRFLRDELGLEPSPALQKLQQAILRQDPALDAPEPEPIAGLPGEERRTTVTVVFSDIVGSTELGAGLDPEAYRALLRRYYRTARRAFERHGGTVEKFIGDAVVAVFGFPQRHEDDAVRAVRAAVELRDSLPVLNSELERVHGVTIRVRTGLNTGEAIAGEPDSTQSFATGYAMNLAAKLQQSAEPDTILVGAATYRLVRDAVMAEAVEPLAVGGKAAPIQAYRISTVTPGAAAIARNLRAPLVGRQDELVALSDEWEEVCAERACRVATVLGEAGIGKSRLAAELVASLGDDAAVLVGRCVSYGEGATYLPIAEVVRRVVPDGSEAGIAALLGDDPDARLIARRVRELLGWEEGAPPAGEGFWAVRRLLEALAHAKPLLLVLDDVHWAEPTLLELVDHLVAQSDKVPILVLCLARPDLTWERPATLKLEPLSDGESAELVGNLPGGEDVSGDLRRRIVGVAEGNALYAEQLLAHALETGEEAFDAVPGSLDALLASRLDVLPPAERGVLERAAVIGREFWRGAVSDLAGGDVDEPLAALSAKGLVEPFESLLAGEEAFRFHHVLIRDVAYAGITKERRSKLHESVAGWLAVRETGWDEILGYHLEQAYRYREQLGPIDARARRLAEAAGERLGEAGIRAWKRADAPAAVNLLGRATSLLPDGEQRAELLCELAVALSSAGDGRQMRSVLEEALAVASAAGGRRIELRASVELAHAGMFGVAELEATPDDLLACASNAIPVLEEFSDKRALGRTWLFVADVHALRLNNAAWREAAANAVSHYRQAGWSPAVCFTGQAAALFYGSVPVRAAIRDCHILLQEAGGDRQAEASISLVLGGLEAMRGAFDDARQLTDRAKATYEEHGARLSLAAAYSGFRAEIERAAHGYGTAERILRDSCAALEDMAQSAALATRAAQLGDLLCEQRRYDEAEPFGQLAQTCAPEGDIIAQASWRAVQGRVLAHRRKHARALVLAQEALALVQHSDAVNQRAKLMLDLAEVLQAADRRPDEITTLITEAARLYRQKGNLVSARHARVLLKDLTPATA